MNKDYYIWLKDLGDPELYKSSIITMLKVDELNRSMIWDLWKEGVGSEYFDSPELQNRYVEFDNYILHLYDELGIEYEMIVHDTLEYQKLTYGKKYDTI